MFPIRGVNIQNWNSFSPCGEKNVHLRLSSRHYLERCRGDRLLKLDLEEMRAKEVGPSGVKKIQCVSHRVISPGVTKVR
jgi:hypothetical protein